MRAAILHGIVLTALLCTVTPAADIETQAREIDTQLMAPCCGANTLAEHDSPAAHQMKREIRSMLAAGRTRQEILDHYVAQHGQTILSMPPARGFNLVRHDFRSSSANSKCASAR